MKLYIDADVWLNFWQDEMLGFIPASHYAEQLLEKIVDKGWTIVISDAVKKEVFEKNITPEDFEERLYKIRKAGLVEDVETTQKDIDFAEKLFSERRLHHTDALHAALVIRSKAMLVTRNIKHFKVVEDLIEIRKPEDLL